MFDIDFYYDFGPKDLGTVEKTEYCSLLIKRSSWAPGLWAGIKDTKIAVKNDQGLKCTLDVTYVDLDKARVWFKVHDKFVYNIEEGDKLYLAEEK